MYRLLQCLGLSLNLHGVTVSGLVSIMAGSCRSKPTCLDDFCPVSVKCFTFFVIGYAETVVVHPCIEIHALALHACSLLVRAAHARWGRSNARVLFLELIDELPVDRRIITLLKCAFVLLRIRDFSGDELPVGPTP